MQMTDGDNRWAAVLSTDLAGFTELSHSLGSEQIYELLTHVLGLARRAIEAQGGHVIDTAGDGILAAFGAPNALENASLQSCRAAAAFQDLLEADRDALGARFGVDARFRTGIGGGNTMVARLVGGEIKLVGAPVNKAARLQSLADPGETLISETIRREAEGFIETTDRGLVEIKGFSEPIQIHRLNGLAQTATKFDGAKRRGITRLVSRADELAQLRRVLGPGDTRHLVLLRGAAGIGKSRLTHEVCETDPRPAYIGQCQPSGNAAGYAPFMDIFRQASGAPWGAGRAEVLATLLKRYPMLDGSAAALSQSDTSGDQADHALKLRALFFDLLTRIHNDAPGLFVIEDMHWVDPASDALLAQLVESELPLLVTSRPEYRADWLDHDRAVTVDLGPLNLSAIQEISESNLQGALSPDLAALINEKAEGIPLMAEEIARALRQDGHLNDTSDGIALTGDPGLLLTGNLEQLVLARVDRLDPQDKAVLEHAAAIGRDFSANLLGAALGRDAGLDRIAQIPGLIELIEPGHWRFAHALIRDAVYGGLLSATRKEVHDKIAAALVASPRFGPEQSALLAQHYLRSSDSTKAAPHLVRAAGQSLAAYALQEVDDQLCQAQELLGIDPHALGDHDFSDMVVYWLRAMDYMGNFGRGLEISERLMPRLEALGYSSSLSIARMLTTIALAHMWDYDRARLLAETTLREADQQKDASGAAWAKVALLRILDESKGADITTLEQLVVEIEPVAAQTGDRHMAMTAIYLLCSAYRSAGMYRKAMSCADQIEEFATTHNDRRARAYAMWARALVHSVKGNPEACFEVIREARAFAIPGSGDARVCQGIEYYSASLLRPSDTNRAKIDALAEEARVLGDFNISGSMDWSGAVSDLRAGALAQGWDRLDALLGTVNPAGNLNLLHQVLAVRFEFLLALAGLIDPEAEAPPDRPKAPRKRPGLRDIARFVTLRTRAYRLAEESITASLTLSPISPSPHFARCKIGLGLIRAAQKRPQDARSLLQEGLACAEAEQLDILSKRARDALAAL